MGKKVNLLVLSVLGACGSGAQPDAARTIDATRIIDAMRTIDAARPDARPGAYDCAGDPLPTMAPAMINITGDVQELTTGGTSDVPNAVVTAFRVSDAMQIGETTASAAAAFTLSLPTGETPLDFNLTSQHPDPGTTNWLSGSVYPPHALSADQEAPVLLAKNSTVDLLHTLLGITREDNTGTVFVLVGDCSRLAAPGVIVTNSANAPVRYVANGFPSNIATATGDEGIALILNVPPGPLTIDASAGTVTFRDRPIMVTANSITSVALLP